MSKKKLTILGSIRIVKDYFRQSIWKNKWWIILITLFFSGIYIYSAWKVPKSFQGKLSFMINEDEGGSLNSVGALLGSLGLGGGSNTGHNYEKIVELGLSNNMLKNAFHEKFKTYRRDADILLGNKIIEEYNYNDKWIGDKNLKNFRFDDSKIDDAEYDYQLERAVKEIAKKFRGMPSSGKPGIFKITYNKESKILYIGANAKTEELTIALCKTLYEVISKYYVSKTIERQASTYNHMKHKADSIYGALKSAEYRLARFTDRGNGIRLNTKSLPLEQLTRKVEMLYMMYGTAVQNLETSEFLMKSSTPFFQKIDDPVEPLQVIGQSKLIGLIRGAMTGFILAILFFVGKYWLVSRIEEEKAYDY